MCESITKLTGPKLGQRLLKVFEPIVKPPIESMAKLEACYKQHCDSITLLQGVDINIDPIIQTFLLHEMVSKLAEQQRFNTMHPGHPIVIHRHARVQGQGDNDQAHRDGHHRVHK